MFIQTQDTPNPQTLKFIPGVVVMPVGTKNFLSNENLSASPLAQMIFKVKGVQSIFLSADFISVTKNPEEEWDYLKPQLLAAIMDHYLSGLPTIQEEQPAIKKDSSGDAITQQIIDIIETRVRPAVAQDGGDIIFKDFKEGVVYLEMHGACSGCPSATVTLKSGIENMLKHYVPEIVEVVAV